MNWKLVAIPVSLAVMVVALRGCRQPPQFTYDEEFRAADVLYTAITSKRPQLLQDADDYVRTLSGSGRISPRIGQEFQHIVELARTGEWQPAAEQLSKLIHQQAGS